MASFNYYSGIREDFSAMIGEIGTSCTISVPTRTVDAWGNLTNVTYTDYTETIWIRPLNEVLSVEPYGHLDRQDIRFVAGYDTHIVPEAKITVGGISYFVITIDDPNESMFIVTRVGLAKKEVS